VRRLALPCAIAVLATLVAGLLVGDASIAQAVVGAYLACLAGCAAWLCIPRAARQPRRQADPLRAALSRSEKRAAIRKPDELLGLELSLSAASGAALDAQFRLRPRLRELACALLLARRGVAVDPVVGDVASALGVTGEPLLEGRPARRPPITEPGPSLAAIGAVVGRLESI
jgi:hypothetical protein